MPQVVAEQPAVAGNAVATLEQAQARPKADGIVGEDRLAELALQPLDDAHRRPVAARHDDGVRLGPVGAAAELVGRLGAGPAERTGVLAVVSEAVDRVSAGV